MNTNKLSRLVERAKQGDEEAFAAIYGEFARSVYYIGLRMTKSEFDARDIVQETMIKLYKNLHTIENAQAVVSFVNQIAYRCSIDVLQKNKPLQMDDDMELVLQNIPDDDAEFIPEEFVAKKEKREAIVHLIEELSESKKSVLLLYYFGQFSVKEISEILSIDVAAVKTRLSRARATLKQMLEKTKLVGVLMSIPALTRILQMDAQAAFSLQTSMEIWKKTATELGYSTATIAATAAVATMPATTSAVTAGLSATFAKLALAGVTAATIGGAVLFTDIPTRITDFVEERVPLSGYFDFNTASSEALGETVGDTVEETTGETVGQAADSGMQAEVPTSDGSPVSEPPEAVPLPGETGDAASDAPSDAGEISISTAGITASNRRLSYPAGQR